jgi:hypothetical protein
VLGGWGCDAEVELGKRGRREVVRDEMEYR